jgi:hypothetical protein
MMDKKTRNKNYLRHYVLKYCGPKRALKTRYTYVSRNASFQHRIPAVNIYGDHLDIFTDSFSKRVIPLMAVHSL